MYIEYCRSVSVYSHSESGNVAYARPYKHKIMLSLYNKLCFFPSYYQFLQYPLQLFFFEQDLHELIITVTYIRKPNRTSTPSEIESKRFGYFLRSVELQTLVEPNRFRHHGTSAQKQLHVPCHAYSYARLTSLLQETHQEMRMRT